MYWINAPVQARHRTLQHHEARAGNPAGRLEVHQRHLLADGDVVERREIELARRAPAAHLDIGVLVAAVRDAVVQCVRQAEHQLVELRLHRPLLLVEALELASERLALGQQRR